MSQTYTFEREYELEYDLTLFLVDGGIASFTIYRNGHVIPQEKISPETWSLFRDMCRDHMGSLRHGMVNFKDWLELPFKIEFTYSEPHPLDRDEWGEFELNAIDMDDVDFYEMMGGGFESQLQDEMYDYMEHHIGDYKADEAAAYGDYMYDRMKDDKLTGDR